MRKILDELQKRATQEFLGGQIGFGNCAAQGVDSGEFRASALEQFPHLIVSPVLFSIMYSIVFDKHETLDSDRMLEAHVDLVVRSLKITRPEGSTA